MRCGDKDGAGRCLFLADGAEECGGIAPEVVPEIAQETSRCLRELCWRECLGDVFDGVFKRVGGGVCGAGEGGESGVCVGEGGGFDR